VNPMTTTIEITCPEDAALIERYALMLRESRALAATTPLSELIDVCEMSVIEKGREVNRATLEELVQQRLRDVEKKGSCVAVAAGKRKRIVVRGSERC
jgi:hypothetical protein